MYGEYYVSPEQIKAQQEAEKQRIKDKHDEKLESLPDGGMGGPDRSQIDTHFMSMGIPKLHSMILDADPNRIYEVSQHWKAVHNILSGGDGDGKTGGVDQVSSKDSVAGMMQSAVENVLEHWEGDAAEAFRKKANEITGNVRTTAAWANTYAEVAHAVQNDLRNSMSKMREVKEPSGWDRAWDKLTDDNRSDKQLLDDINKGVSTDAARQANADSLSKGKEEQLKGVAIMEQLAVNYKAYAKQAPIDDHRGDPFAPPNPSTPMPTPIPVPSAGNSRPSGVSSTAKPWSAGTTTSIKPTPTTPTTPTLPRDPGVTGGSQLPAARTNVDSISPGLNGTGPSTGVGGASVGGGSFGTGGAASPSIGSPGGAAGLAAGSAGGIGAVSGRGGLAGGGAAAGRGAAGRAGTGGMGGLGAAGRGGASAGGRGALARARGGVVGSAKGVAGKGAGGGSGLHGSRGGTQRGGMAGAAGAAGKGRRSEDENSRGDRPDYLVEDEETWISEEDRNRNVPRTIE